MEIAAAWSLAIAGVLVLARALLELVEGLAELPGAGEHWAGDVIVWLVFVLPIPLLAGATLLAAAWWLWHRRIGPRASLAVVVAAIAVAIASLLVEAMWSLGQGNFWGSLDDPLIWTPVALLIGAVAGAVILVVLLVAGRRPHGARTSE